MHRAVALYYQRTRANLNVTLEDLNACLHSTWEEEKGDLPLRFTRGATEAAMQEQAWELLTCFLKEVKLRLIEAVEKPFTVDLVNPDIGEVLPVKLVGVIDLIESDGEGQVVLSELKTSARKYSESQGEHHLDGAVYAYAMQQLGYTTTPDQVLVRFDVLIKTKAPQFEQLYFNKGEVDFRKFLRLTAKVLRAVDREVFLPNEGWYCTTCPFRARCVEEQSR
jgi:hypothetical protein